MERMYKGWKIRGVGGYCTIRHFWASKDDLSFWQFKLKESKCCIDHLENNDITINDLNSMYRKSLYN